MWTALTRFRVLRYSKGGELDRLIKELKDLAQVSVPVYIERFELTR